MRVQLLSLLLLAVLKFWTARAEVVAPVAHDQWFQLQTPSFVLFCDGRIDRVRRLAVGLEQFREGYAKLAGAKDWLLSMIMPWGGRR